MIREYFLLLSSRHIASKRHYNLTVMGGKKCEQTNKDLSAFNRKKMWELCLIWTKLREEESNKKYSRIMGYYRKIIWRSVLVIIETHNPVIFQQQQQQQN